jgi:hypothetical protein
MSKNIYGPTWKLTYTLQSDGPDAKAPLVLHIDLLDSRFGKLVDRTFNCRGISEAEQIVETCKHNFLAA